MRIGLEELELLVGRGSDLLWQLLIRAPEARGGIYGSKLLRATWAVVGEGGVGQRI